MAGVTLDDFLRGQHDAIVYAVQTRMKGDQAMGRVADRQGLSESELSSQVVGFFLQAIRADAAIGSTTTLEENLQWLVVLRSGHDLPFGDEMVMHMFDEVSEEIEARLPSKVLREEYKAYREKGEELVRRAFPECNGG